MGRSLVLLFAAVAATVLVGAACETQRVEVGELQTESRSVDLENADSVQANLRIGLGELKVGGGADSLMEADFAYNVAAWQPEVNYEVVGDTGELTVEQQGLREGIPTRDVRNEWDLRLSDDVPVDLSVQMGGGVGNLDLNTLALTGLNIVVGAGVSRVDLAGDWDRDLSAVIRGGAGQVTVLLPSRVGVRVDAGTRLGRINADGLRREGQAFVNDAYGDSDVTLTVEVQGGAGQINLEVVQEVGQQEATRQQGGDTTTLEQGGETTMTQGGETTMMPGGETTTREQGADVGLPAVLENPQRYYGQKLTLSGAVGQVIEAQAFVMVDRQALQGGPLSAVELADRGVLVVHTGGSVPNVAEPQNVRVTGLLQRFDISAFEQQQGINLDDELYTQYEDRPALLAAEIRPTQGELTTQ
ncbi:MAG: toast rack family protein [Actinomycetota bacterium]|nr:toast rack family protein [Actinomycetota bacterium]